MFEKIMKRNYCAMMVYVRTLVSDDSKWVSVESELNRLARPILGTRCSQSYFSLEEELFLGRLSEIVGRDILPLNKATGRVSMYTRDWVKWTELHFPRIEIVCKRFLMKDLSFAQFMSLLRAYRCKPVLELPLLCAEVLDSNGISEVERRTMEVSSYLSAQEIPLFTDDVVVHFVTRMAARFEVLCGIYGRGLFVDNGPLIPTTQDFVMAYRSQSLDDLLRLRDEHSLADWEIQKLAREADMSCDVDRLGPSSNPDVYAERGEVEVAVLNGSVYGMVFYLASLGESHVDVAKVANALKERIHYVLPHDRPRILDLLDVLTSINRPLF